MNTSMVVEDEFDEFMAKVFPSVSKLAVQYRESRRIWHASAWSVLFHIQDVCNTKSEDEGCNEINSIMRQLHEYFELINKDSD